MLRIAVAKGRLLDSFLELLNKAGYDCSAAAEASRKLVIDVERAKLRFILAKPADVPTYVEYGTADLGVVGKDILVESDRNVAELLDLRYGLCRLVVAVPKDSGITKVQELDFNSRVASKYPRIAEGFFNSLGIQVEIIPLNGSIELGPMVGLSEAIVDITATGRTLAENGLVVVETIMESTSRLVANRISLKTQREAVGALAGALERVI